MFKDDGNPDMGTGYGHIKKLDHGLPLKYLLCPFTVIDWNRGLLLNYLI